MRLVAVLEQSAVPEIALLADEIADELESLFDVTPEAVQRACLAYGPKAFPARMRAALETLNG